MRVLPPILLFLSLLVQTGEVLSVATAQRKPRPPSGRAARASATPDKSEEKLRNERIRDEAFGHPFDEAKLKAYFDLLPKDGARYIVEGDLLLTEQDLRVYVERKAEERKEQEGKPKIIPGPELVININQLDGKDDYYADPAKRTLTFAVDRNSFPAGRVAWYQTVVRNVRAAAQEWQGVCPNCRIRFVYMKEYDGAPTHDKVNFIVRYHDVKGEYIAASFFPHDGPLERYLNVDPSYFTTEYDQVGVMRHELGHVLGYRHEHTRGVAGCYYEDDQWRPLTGYDARSVMHYFCGGGGGLGLKISPTDKAGHRRQYALTTRRKGPRRQRGPAEPPGAEAFSGSPSATLYSW
jgi:hypothetical protein